VRDLAGNQHLAVVLIAFQGIVTIAPASAARLDQAARVTVQQAAAGDGITSAPIRGISRVLRTARGADEDQTANASSLLAGLGVSYVFLGHWSARLDYLRIQDAGNSTTGKYNAGILAVGASYTF
jgi:hypothetical protein